MSNIFNLQEEYLTIMQELEDYCIENETDEIPVELQEKLKITQDNVENKIRAYYYIKLQQEAEIKLLQDVAATLAKKVKAKEKVIERIKEYAQLGLLMFGTQQADKKTGEFKNISMKFPEFTLYNVYHKPLTILEDADIPEVYKHYRLENKLDSAMINSIMETLAQNGIEEELKIDTSIDKKKLKEDVKEGVEIDGVTIDKQANYIVFK